MNLIERVASERFMDQNHFYHSIKSATNFFKEKIALFPELSDWRFEVVSSTSKKNIGYCSYSKKLVAIQAHFFFAMSAELVEETILHELAHALTQGHKHDKVWRAKALELGDKRARATTPLRSSLGFRPEWIIESGHPRKEVIFDAVAFTSQELPRSKNPSSPNFGGKAKRVHKPTKLATSLFYRYKNVNSEYYWNYDFMIAFMNEGYSENYAKVQWNLCKSYFE
ncbi:hypothetical protein AVV36_gp165 [Pectobacterium bacteriophage PM2]|uniref:SprT-like domain-containing protein n=1 Tax=Pectobacterium bacteriophage PM2 TaxID=1429794 RepID=A0A0A0Q2I3_9CAUD|nr:hypothetical protein AVV36_gp165 [Pectobacterium bacteriophage PM2]AHY25245.1 hypothetical protein PM2_283 [Pectobacterium bacteriophage PM2]